MSRQELAETLQKLRDYICGESEQTVRKCRGLLCNLVETVLTNVEGVAETLSKVGESAETFSTLQLVSWYSCQYPAVFVHGQSGEVSQGLSKLDEDRHSHAFTCWCISRILRLLSHKGCARLHEKCRDTIIQLLLANKWRDPPAFKEVLTELIHYLAELARIGDRMLQSDDETFSEEVTKFVVPVHLLQQSISDKETSDEAIKLSSAPLMLCDMDSCELIQTNIVKILEGFVSDVVQFAGKQLYVFWGLLCCHMEFGDAGLKSVSMKAVVTLLRRTGLPSEQLLNYLLDCITAMVKLLCSGCKGVSTPEEINMMETEAAELISCVVEVDNCTSFIHHLSSKNLEFCYCKISNSLYEFRNHKSLGTDMKLAIGQFICHMTSRFPVQCLMGRQFLDTRKRLIHGLLHDFGTSLNLQFMVGPVVQMIQLELSSKSHDPDRDKSVQEPKEETLKGKKLPKGRAQKRKASSDEERAEIVRHSYTYRCLYEKFQEVLTTIQAQQEVSPCYLEAVRVIMEVAGHCVMHQNKHREKTSADSDKPDWKKPSRPVQFFSFIKLEDVDQILACWKKFLQCHASDVDVFVVNTGVQLIAQCISSMLTIHIKDSSIFEASHMQQFGWLLTLPWIPTEAKWMDLTPPDPGDVAKLASVISDKLDPLTLGSCVRALSFMPKGVLQKWRCQVLRLAVNDDHDDVKVCSMKALPMFLCNLGTNTSYLIKELIHPLLRKPTASAPVMETIARIMGRVTCVISRSSSICLCDSADPSGTLSEAVDIRCQTCNTTGSGEDRTNSVSAPFEPQLLLPFLQLLTEETGTAKAEMTKNLEKVFSHLVFRPGNNASMTILTSCLSLVEDTDFQIRMTFSKAIGPVIRGDNPADASSPMPQLIIKRLMDVYKQARTHNNIRLQETIIMTIGQLGRFAEGDLLGGVMINLLEKMLSHNPLVAAFAYHQLRELSAGKNIKMQSLYMGFRQQVCKFIVDALHDAEETPGGKDAEHILQEVTNVLGFADVKSFLQPSKKFLLPQLISKATKTASDLIKVMATHVGYKNRLQFILTNTHYIFSYLMRHCQNADLVKALRFLESETYELGSLLRLKYQQVHNELLLYLSSNYQQVFNGLCKLASHDNKEPREITNSAEMADFLKPRLLGFLTFFDVQLLDSNIPMEEKKLVLESLVSMMRLMGPKHITVVRLKAMATLRIGLQFKEKGFPELSCRAWTCFVRSVEFSALGPMLAQIIATLLPLIEKLPKQVAEIFSFLIVENRDALHDHFHEIYFLPDIPELADARAVLKHYMEGPSSQSDTRSQITHYLKGVTHENLDIRLHALSKLRVLLHENQKQKLMFTRLATTITTLFGLLFTLGHDLHTVIHKLIIGAETADPVISQLVSVLLTGCRESDKRARILYGECLGEMGAIDPGRLDLATNNPRAELAKFHVCVTDDNFGFDLINEIVRAFLAASVTLIQDCSALAMQELLQIYDIGEDKEEEGSPGQKLWRRFPRQTQEILLQYFSSKYVMSSSQDWSKLEKPVFGGKNGSNFKDWVTSWTGYLFSKVKQDKAGRVFQACAAQIKHDVHIALYLLPHVVLYVLQDGEGIDQTEIHNEMMEVILHVKKPDTRYGSASDFRHMSAQTVYSVFDYLNKWRRRRAQVVSHSKAGPVKGEPAYLNDPGYRAVSDFLKQIPQDELSEAAYNCKAYTRAFMYFEQFIGTKTEDIQGHLDFVQRLYAAMDEADGVEGVATVRQSQPTLREQILVHECTGQLTYALACYEVHRRESADDVTLHQGLVRNYMDLGQHRTALVQVRGILAEKPHWLGHLNAYRVEAAWKLGSWDKLETFVKKDTQSLDWSVGLGKALLAARNGNEKDYVQQLKILRGEQMSPLSAASMESGSYQRGYEYIVRLHMLNEFEHGMKTLLGFPSGNTDISLASIPKVELFKQWESRLLMVQFSFRTQEPLLTLRKTLLLLAQENDKDPSIDKEIDQIWLRSAKVARKAGHIQTAYNALLQTSSYSLPQICQEKAKLLYTKGDHYQALSCIEAGIKESLAITALKGDQSEEAKLKKLEHARALLLFGRYSEETSSQESNVIMKQYKEVTDICPEWEDGHFYLARYYDKIMTTLIHDKEGPVKQGEFTIYVVRYFGQSLLYGNQYIYQSLPRLLSLWLDYGSAVMDSEKRDMRDKAQKLQTQRTILARLNKIVSGLRQQLPPYQLFTALPQLISRICHAHPEVSTELQETIAKMLTCFPQQAMWMMMAVSKSSYPMRVKRCQDIFAKAKNMNPDLHRFIQDATKLTERLLELCEKEVPKMVSTLSMTQHFRPLKRLLEDSQFSRILVPLQELMTVTLPSVNESLENHDPFPGEQVYIDTFEDTIEILPSLQKPKKITMKGSNGRLYVMMCKPKDDLRKDCRLMEFNGIVNKFLRKDPESRRRQLHIRTYTVVPLNEECGLIEWVNNTFGLRHILMKLYKEKGLYMSGKDLQACMPALHSSVETKLHIYKTKLLPKHPPLFNDWFLRTFPDPTSWYMARLSYARTTAVMSMVGYILGLGDRHGENILFDSTNGDCVHVDFNCLFNKGETFEWPERVPFRLTPNMVQAMGPLGYEGLFRQACVVTLRVMRNQMDSLMSVLKPFVYDPLVEWSKPVRGRSHATETGEITNEQAMTHVLNIEHRLKGVLKTKTKPRARGLPLSIDGHVNYLIQEATDERNMCQMYIGWAAYL